MDKINRTILYYVCCASVGSSLFASAPQGPTIIDSSKVFLSSEEDMELNELVMELNELAQFQGKLKKLYSCYPDLARCLEKLYEQNPTTAKTSLNRNWEAILKRRMEE